MMTADDKVYPDKMEAVINAMFAWMEDRGGAGIILVHSEDCQNEICNCQPLRLCIPSEIPLAL